ncbi:MAG: hypothetical protein ABR578_10090 [Chromatocurvus sp.]
MRQPRPDRSNPLAEVAFVCGGCRYRFEGPPGRVESCPDQPWHPHRYLAECPECGAEAEQAAWQRSLLKAWANATGPRTAEGLARTAENLEGHPTPDEAKLTRFNAMKHGLFARTAKYFPAKPGSYPHCETCEHMATLACIPQRACLKRAELLLQHEVAFETGDPGLLTGMRAGTQAMIQALIDDMLLTIAMDGGPRIKSPEWYSDKDGGFHLAQFRDFAGELQQIYKLEAHPLLKHLIDYLAKNSMTLADLEMTPKARDEQDALRGYLDKEKEGQSSTDYQQKMLTQQQKLLDLIHAGMTRNEKVIDAEVVSDG